MGNAPRGFDLQNVMLLGATNFGLVQCVAKPNKHTKSFLTVSTDSDHQI